MATSTQADQDDRFGREHASDVTHGTRGVHERPHPSAWMRYRARYATLPPQLQMVGLQMWLPFAFVALFCLCYVNAFHAPQAKNVPVAVVGVSAATAQQLQSGSQGTLRVRTEPDLAAARNAVRDNTISGAYVPAAAGGQARLIVASANQFQLSAELKAIFGSTAAAEKATLSVEDLAPLPTHDLYGTGLFYVALVWTISGYMTGMFLGMMGGLLPHRVRLGVLAAASGLLSLLTALLVGPLLGAVQGHFLETWGIGWLVSAVVGLVVNGAGYFLNRFVTGFALLVFVFANIPSSSGAYPPELVPEPFRWLNHVVIGAGTLDVMRSVIYHVGPGVLHGMAYLGAYALVGLILTFAGKPYATWRIDRRLRRNGPPNMMVAAQLQLMAPMVDTHRANLAAARDQERDVDESVESDEGVVAAAGAGPAAGAGAAGGA